MQGRAEVNSLSADVDLVVYNVAKNVKPLDLCNWLSQKGLFVKDCKLLTTSDEARSLSYRITINPKDFDKATQDANLWPYGVGVRLYKNFRKSSQKMQFKVANERQEWKSGRYDNANRVKRGYKGL